MAMRKTRLERIIVGELRRTIEHLPLKDGDIVVVKDEGTWQAIGAAMQQWKPAADVAFILAPEGLSKCSAEDLQTALNAVRKVVLV